VAIHGRATPIVLRVHMERVGHAGQCVLNSGHKEESAHGFAVQRRWREDSCACARCVPSDIVAKGSTARRLQLDCLEYFAAQDLQQSACLLTRG
jgi:hypothetical protein